MNSPGTVPERRRAVGKLIFISGPSGSGKSRFAEQLIAMTEGERLYVATMKPCTAENFRRIAAHRAQRKDLGFRTFEIPSDLAQVPAGPDSVVLLEDVSNFLSNLLFDEHADLQEAYRRIVSLQARCRLLFAVTISGLREDVAPDAEQDQGGGADRTGVADPVRDAGYDAGTREYIRSLNALNRLLSERSDACAEMERGKPVWRKLSPGLFPEETLEDAAAPGWAAESGQAAVPGWATESRQVAGPERAAESRQAAGPKQVTESKQAAVTRRDPRGSRGSWTLELDHLSVGWYGRPVLRDVNLRVRRGEMISLIGPNGAGKSTLLKTVIQQLKRISGSVALMGRDLGDYGNAELAQLLSVVLTNPVRPERMTCRDVVAAGRDPYTGRMGILRAEDRRAVEEALSLMDIADIANRDFSALSDGQRQRVLIARALCQDPEILVMDEPASFLDVRYKLELLALLRRLSRERNLTVLLSMHEIDLALKCSDRILLASDSGKVYEGAPESFLENNRLSSLFHIPPDSFDPLLGCTELQRIEGAPRVFVLSAGGRGIPVYRMLQRAGVPFAAGILYTNDIDCRLAEKLAVTVIKAEAFQPVREETMARALRVLDSCDAAVDAGFPESPFTQCLSELRDHAAECGELAAEPEQALEMVRRRSKEGAAGTGSEKA